MRVDVGGGRKIAVAEPFLYLLHRDDVCKQQARAGVAKVVEADAAQAVAVEKLRERRRDVVGLYERPQLVHADIAEVVPAVAFSAQPPLPALLLLKTEQPVLEKGHERQSPHAGLVLRPVGGDHHLFAVYAADCNHVANGDGVVLKVHGVPLETHDLAAP